jgi:hypothetical protein
MLSWLFVFWVFFLLSRSLSLFSFFVCVFLSLSLSLCIISIYPPAYPLCFFCFGSCSPVSVSCPLFTRYWLPKTVKTMVNAGSRLCVFIRWCFSLGLRLLCFWFYILLLMFLRWRNVDNGDVGCQWSLVPGRSFSAGTKTMVGLILVYVSDANLA